MQNQPPTATAAFGAHFSTEELSVELKNQPQTIRAGLCRNGHYLGLRPIKLPNGRLLWNAAEVAALLESGVK